MKRRILSIITALALCLSLCPTWAFAAETDPALCSHHPAHTEECGCIAPTEGQPCGHEHTAECYTEEMLCVHVHDENCYSDGLLPAEGEDKAADACAHECGEESGCVTKELDCRHTHDEDCGYVQADPGTPCGYECRVCPIEDLIAALPDEVTPDNADEVRAQLDQILTLFSELNGDEQGQIDLSHVYALQRALDGANAPYPVAESVNYREASWNSSEVVYADKIATCTPVENSADAVTWSESWYAVTGTVTIDQPITVTGDVSLILTDGCTLNAEQGIVVTKNNSLTIYAQSGGTGTLNATGTTDSANNASAGIGGSTDASSLDSGDITIHGGIINATGGKAGYYGGAGIGGSTSASENGGNSGTITIYGGTVTANSGTGNVTGAGIGGGSSSSGTDGTVGGDGSGIIIYGGDVTATSHATAAGGAGIGGGAGSHDGGAGNIAIRGGTVWATGGKLGAGIGGGSGDSDYKSGDGTVTISGGTVTAVGGSCAAGIGGGGGYQSQYVSPVTGGTGTVNITGGLVDAKGGEGGSSGAPIGNGGNASGGSVEKTTGIVFENGKGTVCGNVTFAGSYEVPANYSLHIPTGASLSGSGTLTGGGTFTTANLTADMISVPTNLYYDGTDRTDEIDEKVAISGGVTVCGQKFTVSGWTVTVSRTDDLHYTATYTNESDSSKNFTKTITLQQSGTQFVGDGAVKAYKGDAETKDFTADDTITVKATPTPTGDAPTKAAARLRSDPLAGQMAVYVGEAQVSAPADKDADGAYTMTVSAAEVLVAAGGPGTGITLTAKFVGNDSMADGEGTVTVNISAAAKVVNGSYTTYVGDLADAFKTENNGAAITLLADVTRTAMLDIRITCSLDLGGHTITCTGLAVNIWSNGNLTIQGTGEIISASNWALDVGGKVTLEGGTFTSKDPYSQGVYVNSSGASLSVTGKNVTIQNTGGGYGLAVKNAQSQSVQLSAGKYSGTAGAISIVDGSLTLGDLLGHSGDTRYAYFDESGTPPLTGVLSDQSLTGTVTVRECKHNKSVCEYTPNESADTHAMTCLACGYAGAAEDCQYTYTPDSGGEHHTTACQFCGRAKTETHTYGLWTPEYNESTVTIRRICENCKYTKTDGTITAPSEIQTMEYGTPITLTCSSTLPDATFEWVLMDADIGADRTPVQESTGASFTLSEKLAVGEYRWEVRVNWAGSDNNTWNSSDYLQVTPAPLPDVTLSPASAVYNGTAQKPAVAIDGLTEGTDYTVAYTGDFTNAGTHTVTVTGKGNYEGTVTKIFTIEKAALTADGSGIAAGTYGAKLSGLAVTGLTAKLNGTEVPGTWKLTGDAIPNAGNTETHEATFTPTGNGENYKPLTAQVTLNIAKATALPTKPGDLAVANGRAHTYNYGLGALRPDVPEGMSLGSAAVTYELGTVSLGSYYTSGAKIEGQTLTLPIEAVESNSETGIGTITVTIHTGNYEDMTATINVRSVNKIIPTGGPTLSTDTLNYGQTLSAITLSGSMQDNGTSVPGTFAWSSPDNRPAVQEKYAAAWTFTPTDNGKYAIVTGTALIRVLPAPIAGAVIVLEPSAFRYQEGKTQKPSITSVTLNGTELTADVDYTAAIPEGTEAGTYTVTLTGKGNYTGTATAVFQINPVEQKPLNQKDDDGHELRLEVETGLSTVPDALENISEYDTPAKIESALRTRVAEVLSNVGEQIAVFDVTLQYKDSSGTWHNVDPDNFPADGVTAVLPYPAGTGATGYTFTVQHLISSGAQAGTMETLAYDLTTDGLRCRFSSLSPVAIGYQAAAKPNPPSNPGGNGGGGWSSSTYAVTVEKSEHGKVTSNRTNASSGSTVTLTVTPDSGYVLNALTVTDSRGNEIKLTAQSGGKYTFTMPSRAVTVKAVFVSAQSEWRNPYTDVVSGAWYYNAVRYASENGLMGGYGNGLFGPNDNLSRAQFAQILFNREGRPVVNYLLQYGDVASGAWYTEAVRWATSQGIVGGYDNGMFGPNDNITREQLAVMLWRYAGSPAATEKELHFTDADKASGYALEALRWAVENDIISGYGDGRLGPQGLATRAQVAQMLMNFLNK